MELDKKFYEKTIEELRTKLKCLEIEGVEGLHPFDRERGTEWAKNSLNEQIEYFMGKIQNIK